MTLAGKELSFLLWSKAYSRWSSYSKFSYVLLYLFGTVFFWEKFWAVAINQHFHWHQPWPWCHFCGPTASAFRWELVFRTWQGHSWIMNDVQYCFIASSETSMEGKRKKLVHDHWVSLISSFLRCPVPVFSCRCHCCRRCRCCRCCHCCHCCCIVCSV